MDNRGTIVEDDKLEEYVVVLVKNVRSFDWGKSGDWNSWTYLY